MVLMMDRVHVGVFSQLRPTVNFVNRLSAAPGQEWGPRTISDCQLVYVISGEGELQLGPDNYNLHAGDCVFYGAESPHRLTSSFKDPFTFSSIHFSWDTDSPEPIHPVNGLRNCSNRQLAIPARKYLVHLSGYGDIELPHYFSMPNKESFFMQMVREYRTEEPGYPSILRGLLTQLLAMILRSKVLGQQSSSERRKIIPALEAIRKQPQQNWRTEELAGMCGYHPTYFAVIFKKTMGCSPKHYLVQERIRRAKDLLLELQTVEEVADKSGYTSTHYFSRNFKMMTGLTPTEFRQQNFEL